ncbi:hypothetical protein EJ04DRAFT_582593 [Polyplosphaeria fusca]|uniref:Uncharacterized protein n=1 Tax=Polyplosphaeria fusca TaxID=682080 RepID=A0A9P4QKG3_9PLEO|nr:hypothetical protein EJ04DRAFT_582593 [Polyplosphaeria fusca]
MNPNESQKLFFQRYAVGTPFVLNPTKPVVAEFTRLGKVRKWVIGKKAWNKGWKECFGFPYDPNKPGLQTSADNESVRAKNFFAKHPSFSHDKNADVMSEFLRLNTSLGRTVGSLSFRLDWLICFGEPWRKSAARDRIHDEDDESHAGGVALGVNAQDDDDVSVIASELSSLVLVSIDTDSEEEAESEEETESGEETETDPRRCEYWYQFPGFTPNPTMSFKKEFKRLADSQGWSARSKKYHDEKAAACYAEFFFHFNMGEGRHPLQDWQVICEAVGIKDPPGSINMCKKGSQWMERNGTEQFQSIRNGSGTLPRIV